VDEKQSKTGLSPREIDIPTSDITPNQEDIHNITDMNELYEILPYNN